MARLFLAKDFLPEYARLEKRVQSAVESAIAEFTEHTYAGLHLEKLTHTKDDRIRTIRIDSSWRGVVLAPERGDVYCLLAVMPHDEAIRYARSRRFSVNEAVGVLEVRNEEAIERKLPQLQAASSTASELLFAKVSDSDLKRLGVDSGILPLVRLLVTAEHLEAMEPVLPQVQYLALYSLACGMTVDEAWEQVSQYAPAQPPPQVDTADLALAMHRTSDQITPVSGPAELAQILAHPFAAWRTFLHPAQQAIAYHPGYSGPAQVTGGAGTGKTVTALHRTAFLAKRLRPASPAAQADPPILLTTFTTNLAEALDAQLALLIGDDRVRGRIEVLNVDKLAYRLFRQAHGSPRICDPARLGDRFAAGIADARTQLSPSFLIHEWEQVILAQNLTTQDAYLACRRAGRSSPLSHALRRQSWEVIQHVIAELAADGESTYLQITAEATRLLAESRQALYRHVVIDEGQDLHPAQWRLLRAAAAPGPDDLFIAADPYQRIYDNHVSLASLGINVRGRSRRLTVNYRTTAEILAWAVPILGTRPVTGLDDQTASLVGYRSPVHGPRPETYAAVTRDDELAARAAQIRDWIDHGIEPHAIGVAARSGAVARQARELLKSAGIATLALNTRSPRSAVRAGTMHGMKGLEFQAVAVIGVESGAVPAPSALTPADEDPLAYEQDLQRERCVLFVACTRARDHLYASWTGQPSPFLPR